MKRSELRNMIKEELLKEATRGDGTYKSVTSSSNKGGKYELIVYLGFYHLRGRPSIRPNIYNKFVAKADAHINKELPGLKQELSKKFGDVGSTLHHGKELVVEWRDKNKAWDFFRVHTLSFKKSPDLTELSNVLKRLGYSEAHSNKKDLKLPYDGDFG